MSEVKPPFVERVILENYKSIRRCDVMLAPLTVVVGPNGSGKSNFLDALAFIGDAMRGLPEAIAKRGGWQLLFHHSDKNSPRSLRVEIHLVLSEGRNAKFSLALKEKWLYGLPMFATSEIAEEACSVRDAKGACIAEYTIQNGKMEESNFPETLPPARDRLFLPLASGIPEFRELFASLSGMKFYNINPDVIRSDAMRDSSLGGSCSREGEGSVATLYQIAKGSPIVKSRMEEYLNAILPDFKELIIKSEKEYLQSIAPNKELDLELPSDSPHLFLSFVFGKEPTREFTARSMSDGTLRAFGVLIALFQCLDRQPESPIPLVGIEEPEATLHPAAAGVLMDAMLEASYFTQVLATTHSPELLNLKDFDPGSLLVVELIKGESIIAPADKASKAVMRDRLYTAGELLALNQLRPQPEMSSTVHRP